MSERRIGRKAVEKGHYGVTNLLKAGIAVGRGPVSLHPTETRSLDFKKIYLPTVDSDREDLHNPDWGTIKQGIESRVTAAIDSAQFDPSEWHNLPWDNPFGVRMDRTAGTVVSFSDDHQIPIATELFPADKVIDFLDEVHVQNKATGRKQNVVDQFSIAMDIADNHPVGAAIIAHAAYRSVGRVLDKRVDERFDFPIISESDEISLMKLGESTAHFYDPNYTDPLGDTYHWWGQFLAGTVFELNSNAHPIKSEAYRRTFYYGPPLMTLAREKIMGKTMHSGNHKEVDRQALDLGQQVGELIVSYQK